MTPGDLVTAALILAAAGWLLVRSLFGRKGGCAGCASAGACRPSPRPLVRLGASGGPADGGRGGGEPGAGCGA